MVAVPHLFLHQSTLMKIGILGSGNVGGTLGKVRAQPGNSPPNSASTRSTWAA